MKLEQSFDRKLQAAILDEAEAKLYGEPNNLTFQLIQKAHELLREYADANEYHLEAVIDSLGQIETERGQDYVRARVGWEHPASPYFQFGTSDHTIEGDPVLAFVWERRHNPPDWVAEQYEAVGDGYMVFLGEVEVSGIPESRFVRDALEWWRSKVRA